MEFKLNETQSYDILRQFDSYQDLIKLVNEHAYDIMMRYYNQYLSDSSNWLWKPMRAGKFFSTIAKGSSSFEVYNDAAGKRVFSFNCAEFNINKLQKFGIKYEPIALEVIHVTLETPYVFGSNVENVQKVHNMLLKFGTMPYTADDKVLELYMDVKNTNEKIISVLNSIGVTYEF